MEVTGQLCTPSALLPGEERPVLIGLDTGVGPTTDLEVMEKIEISCPYRELKPDSSAAHLIA
jgi:hypothetical protein